MTQFPATPAVAVTESVNTALAELNTRLAGIDEPHEIAAGVRAFFDTDRGALGQASSTLSLVAAHAEGLIGSMADSDPGYRLWHRLAAASEDLSDLETELADTPDTLHALATAADQGLGLQEAARAHRILKDSGFVENSIPPLYVWHELPDGLSTEEERSRSTRATVLLRAAGFGTELDPVLVSEPAYRAVLTETRSNRADRSGAATATSPAVSARVPAAPEPTAVAAVLPATPTSPSSRRR
ncbi:hypothetical protein [Streptomyces clavuligerus]|uniref:hypothetical protein n=3 Tax=Streptomyces clavuligerus TaxID=1901 RepID=UPI001E43375B|nr:hypothetical protein [Streptomyces clavuligerus]